MEEKLELMKMHLRVDSSFEDPVIRMYIGWAEADIKDSVSTEPFRNESFFDDNKIYDTAVFLQTTFYYENRLGLSERRLNNSLNAPDAVLSAVQKLRGSYVSLEDVLLDD